MIAVKRIAEPKSLKKNSKKWAAELQAAIDAGRGRRELDRIRGRYAQDDVREALELMFSGKCAYCESEISSVSYAHIEHFKPKSSYPTECFEWENLLLACSRCNGKSAKGEKFPLSAEGGPIVNPVKEDPSAFFEFYYDPKLRLALVREKSVRARTTSNLFGLNSRPALLKRRSKTLRLLAQVKFYEAQDPEAAAIIVEAKQSSSEYSAWARALL